MEERKEETKKGTEGRLVVGMAVAVLVVIVALAVRSLIKQKKSGGGCNGDCGHCKGCH